MLSAIPKRPFSVFNRSHWLPLLGCMIAILFSAQGFSENTSGRSPSIFELGNRSKASNKSIYPNFTNNPRFTKRMKRFIAPNLLPKDHPTKAALDEIFAKAGVIRNEKTVREAGFTIFKSQKKSYIRVLKHPLLKGYLLKVYLDTERNIPRGSPGWKRLTMRCVVAKKIKALIASHKIKRFVVADKWVYPLPREKMSSRRDQPLVLIVKNMNIYNASGSKAAWKNKAGYKTVRELYTIFSRGYGSAYLAGNLPYTHDNKFAFIDTEFGKRHLPMERLQRHFAPNVGRYWQSLLHHRPKSIGPLVPEHFMMLTHTEQPYTSELPMAVN